MQSLLQSPIMRPPNNSRTLNNDSLKPLLNSTTRLHSWHLYGRYQIPPLSIMSLLEYTALFMGIGQG